MEKGGKGKTARGSRECTCMINVLEPLPPTSRGYDKVFRSKEGKRESVWGSRECTCASAAATNVQGQWQGVERVGGG